MSLVIVKLDRGKARFVMVALVVLCLAASWFSLKWNFANMLASRVEPDKPEARVVADWLARLSPADPRAHSAAALALERSFDMNDVGRAVDQYEAAAALSPENYFFWLNVGRGRSLNGDTTGAAAAYGRALQLAPNYAVVQWAYGNSLIRQGALEDGLAYLAKAAGSNPEYARPAALMALQMVNGDVDAARHSLGDSDVSTAALVGALASQQRLDDAVAMWAKLPAEKQAGEFSKLGQELCSQLVAAKMFRRAAVVTADIVTGDLRPSVGQITNPGFENEVRMRDAALFDWQISEGAHPQIGLAEGQSFAGRSNLFLLFNSFETAAFRSVSQTIAVEPDAEYELSVRYRSDLRSEASLKLEVVNACDQSVLSAMTPMSPTAEWAALSTRFSVPSGCDGVIIRLGRDGCAGPTCPMAGKLSLDEFSLTQLGLR